MLVDRMLVMVTKECGGYHIVHLQVLITKRVID